MHVGEVIVRVLSGTVDTHLGRACRHLVLFLSTDEVINLDERLCKSLRALSQIRAS